MKTHSTFIKSLVLTLGILLSVQGMAKEDQNYFDGKELVKIRVASPWIQKMIENADFSQINIEDLKAKIEEARQIILNHTGDEIIISVSGDTNSFIIESFNSTGNQGLENWMFADPYDDYSEHNAIEDWMLDTDYYNADSETAPLEDWMFEQFIPETEPAMVIEDWMLDTNYYDDGAQIEDWMLDTNYWD